MKKIQAILFDFDGVILDTYASYRQFTVDVLNELGYEITLKESIKRWKGINGNQISQLLKEEGFEKADDFLVEVTRRSRSYIADKSIIINGLLDVLEGTTLPKAICSNGRSLRVNSNLKDVGLYDYFNVILGRDDSKTMKPDPYVYLMGAEKLGVDIKNCLAIEDSVIGLEAGVKSGAVTVAFTGSGGDEDKLKKLNPDYITDNIVDVLKIIDNLNN